jgi:alpha-beta hydrolase superfamily lysophospholipase
VIIGSVVVSPKKARDKRLPALLIVSALGSPQLIGTYFYSMTRSLAHTAAAAGFRVMRFELRGFGDSEGEDYRDTDFYSEVEDNLAALDLLSGRKDVDPKRVFVFGHSTGGMEAALMAGRRDLAGLAVSCTIGRTFFERLAETVRLQNTLSGKAPAETAENVRRMMAFAGAIAAGDSLPTILAKNPECAAYVNSSGRIMDDRTPAFWRQQLNVNLPEAYGKIAEPVLIVYGASDFITMQVCHEHILDVLVSAGNPDAVLKVIAGLDHSYAFALDQKESYLSYQKQNFRENPEGVETVVRWLADRAAR